MLNEDKAVGYFPGMYLVYDVEPGEDGAITAADKEAALDRLYNQVKEKIGELTNSTNIYDQADMADYQVDRYWQKESTPPDSLGSVVLGDEGERILAKIDNDASQEEKKKKAAQREDVEAVLGKSVGRLKQLQQIFISLLGEQDGNEKFGILLNVIGHPGGPPVESKSKDPETGEPKSSPAPEGKMKNGFLDKAGFPNIFFTAFKNVTEADLRLIGSENSFKNLAGKSPSSEFWSAMYNLAGGNQPAVGIGEIYAALMCNGVQGEDTGKSGGASVDVISHVNGESLNNKKLPAQGATTPTIFCQKVAEIIEEADYQKWPDFVRLVKLIGLNDSQKAPKVLNESVLLDTVSKIRDGSLIMDGYEETFKNPKSNIPILKGMANLMHDATCREIYKKSNKGAGSGKKVFTSWQEGNVFAAVPEVKKKAVVVLPVSGMSSNRVKYEKAGFYNYLDDRKAGAATNTKWIPADTVLDSYKAEMKGSDKFDSTTWVPIEDKYNWLPNDLSKKYRKPELMKDPSSWALGPWKLIGGAVVDGTITNEPSDKEKGKIKAMRRELKRRIGTVAAKLKPSTIALACYYANENTKNVFEGEEYKQWYQNMVDPEKNNVPGWSETTNEALTAGGIYKKSLLEILDLIP